jgi:hypothetical protein
MIAATAHRPPTANRSWLGISLIDSLKESDTPHPFCCLGSWWSVFRRHRQTGSAIGTASFGSMPEAVVEVARLVESPSRRVTF